MCVCVFTLAPAYAKHLFRVPSHLETYPLSSLSVLKQYTDFPPCTQRWASHSPQTPGRYPILLPVGSAEVRSGPLLLVCITRTKARMCLGDLLRLGDWGPEGEQGAHSCGTEFPGSQWTCVSGFSLSLGASQLNILGVNYHFCKVQ